MTSLFLFMLGQAQYVAQQTGIPIPDQGNLLQWMAWVIVVAFFAVLGFFLKMVSNWSDIRSLLTQLINEVKGLKEAIENQAETNKLVKEVAGLAALLTGKVKKLEDKDEGG